jgi:hypothetical protein
MNSNLKNKLQVQTDRRIFERVHAFLIELATNGDAPTRLRERAYALMVEVDEQGLNDRK